MNVKFIDYTGEYPCLCYGVLTLEINGKEYRFGPEEKYSMFWSSGGRVYFDSEWNEFVDTGKWKIDRERLPDEIKQYADEISVVFNNNVEYGCCGGCI